MFETKTVQDTLKELSVDEKSGLPSEVAQASLISRGHNELKEKKKTPIIVTFLKQLNEPMIYILLAAIVVSSVVSIINMINGHEGDWADVVIIAIVIILNAVIGTVQEEKAKKALDALKKLSSPNAFVLRDGVIKEIKARELVVGDIVILEEGVTVPADLRLIESYNLKSDESSLTGESVPILKDADIVFSDNVGIGDRTNCVYMSTPIVYGRGRGVVVATGMNTEIGKIANLLNEGKEEMTPLQKRLADLSKFLGILTIVVIVALFVVSLFQQRNAVEMLLTAISLAVAAVPEGLPAVVTIVLALGVQRMVKVNTIVRRLPSVETLGAVSVVCSDKTGTLTQNKMTVVSAYSNDKVFSKDAFNNDLNFLATGLALCNNASIENGHYGDPTEIALIDFALKVYTTKSSLEKSYPRIDEMPFDSTRKMMSTMHKHDDRTYIFTKGAIDQILKRTTHVLINGEMLVANDDIKHEIQSVANKMSDEALRVLALAYHESTELNENDLIFVGLVGMVDPPRIEAMPAVQKFKDAGITTIMITGDHKNTAFAIAKQLGIANNYKQCISGDDVTAMNMPALQEACKSVRVFARVSPENKVAIVKAFKANGNIVAMTGDGVNDAPSLKSADIGIAMGITGTDVAKGAADMVLTDDNFASIEKAVEEGRSIYANIKKTVLFLLSSNVGEVIAMFVAICIGLPLPLIAIHILWVNLVTDSLPAIALGSDSKDPDIMHDKPRPQKESLFAKGGYSITIGYGLLIAIITLTAFLVEPTLIIINNQMPWSIEQIKVLFADTAAYPHLLIESQTMAFSVLAVSELFHMVGMVNIKKSFVHVFKSKNWLIPLSLGLGIILQVALTYIPGINTFFGVAPLSWDEFLIVVVLSISPLLVHEVVAFIIWIIKKVKARKNALISER